jgi:hypothetical protein
MKLRRLMQIARRGESLPKGSVVRHSKIDRRMTRWVISRPKGDRAAMSALPPKADIVQVIPVASFWRAQPSQPRASQRTRARL